MGIKYLSAISLLFQLIIYNGCENTGNSEKPEVPVILKDTTHIKQTIMIQNRDTISKEKTEEKLPDAPKINSKAPSILKTAYNNSHFNSQKWLKSDRSDYMMLHPGKISEYDKTIKKYARRYGFDWRLIAAQIYTESNFRNEAQSHVGAKGLMQIMPGTAKFMGFSPESMVKPDINIMAGCMYDQRMYSLWGRQTSDDEHRLAFALASYNAGRGRVLKSYDSDSGKTTWNVVHPELPEETQNYVHKIFLKYEYYQKKALP